jgi:hypothetical protein
MCVAKVNNEIIFLRFISKNQPQNFEEGLDFYFFLDLIISRLVPGAYGCLEGSALPGRKIALWIYHTSL